MRAHAGLPLTALPLTPLLLAVFLALAGGCSTIDRHEKVAGWPTLRVVQHRVPDDVFFARCSKYTGFGMLPEACAEFNFDAGVCDVWFSRDYPPQPYVVNHELLHCQGYDHPGETTLRDILARYNEQRRVTAGGTRPPG